MSKLIREIYSLYYNHYYEIHKNYYSFLNLSIIIMNVTNKLFIIYYYL